MDRVMSDWMFWTCAGWTAANIAATHYLFIHYSVCRKGRGLIGRYIAGVLSFGLPYTVWCLNNNTPDPLLAFWTLVFVAGGVTCFCYFGIDANAERSANSKTLDEVLS